MTREELVAELHRIEMHALAKKAENGISLAEIEEQLWNGRYTHPDVVPLCHKLNKAIGRTQAY